MRSWYDYGNGGDLIGEAVRIYIILGALLFGAILKNLMRFIAFLCYICADNLWAFSIMLMIGKQHIVNKKTLFVYYINYSEYVGNRI